MGDLVARSGRGGTDEEAKLRRLRSNADRIIKRVEALDIEEDELEQINRQILELFNLANGLRNEEQSDKAEVMLNEMRSTVEKSAKRLKKKYEGMVRPKALSAQMSPTRDLMKHKPVSERQLTKEETVTVKYERAKMESLGRATVADGLEVIGRELEKLERNMKDHKAPAGTIKEATADKNRFLTEVGGVEKELALNMGTIVESTNFQKTGKGGYAEFIERIQSRVELEVDNYLKAVKEANRQIEEMGLYIMPGMELHAKAMVFNGDMLGIRQDIRAKMRSIQFINAMDAEAQGLLEPA